MVLNLDLETAPIFYPKLHTIFKKFFTDKVSTKSMISKDPDAACNWNWTNSWIYSKSADLCKDTSPHDPDTKVYSYNAS